MPQQVSRLGRTLDAVGVLLFVSGAICYGVAFLGMKRLRDDPYATPTPGGELIGFALDEWYGYRRLSWIGLGIVGLGAAVAAFAAIVHVRQRRGTPPEQVKG